MTILHLVLLSSMAIGQATIQDQRDSAFSNKELPPQQLPQDLQPGEEIPPRRLSGKAPIYPVKHMMDGIKGEVVLIYTVLVDGTTTDFTVESATNDTFAAHAIHAVKQWKFVPAQLDGKPVESQVRQSLSFDF